MNAVGIIELLSARKPNDNQIMRRLFGSEALRFEADNFPPHSYEILSA